MSDEVEKVISDAEKSVKDGVKTYTPNQYAEEKIRELTVRRKQYTDALKQIDEMLMQLRFGISQELVREGSNGCNGFGTSCDMSDYACRTLCKPDIREACREICLQKGSAKASEAPSHPAILDDIESNFGRPAKGGF